MLRLPRGRWSRCGTTCCRTRCGSCPRIWRRWTSCCGIRRCWRRSSAVAAAGRGGWPLSAVGRAPDDLDGHLRAVDGGQAAHRLGVRDAGAGGVGLASPAALLPDRAERAGARRVDGPQADPAAWGGGGARDHAEVIAKARREQRFRPRAARIDSTVVEADVRYPSDAGLPAGGKVACSLGAQARGADRRRAMRSAIARGRSAGGCARCPARCAPHRPGQRGGDRSNAEAGRLLLRSAKEARRLASGARVARAGAVPRPSWRPRGDRAAGRALRAGRRADRQASARREDHRSDRLPGRPRRPADPQGQARPTDRIGRPCTFRG